MQTLFCLIIKTAGELKVTVNKKMKILIIKKHILLEGVFGVWKNPLIKLKELSIYFRIFWRTLKNPKYKDVIYKDTGHVEAIEITYDPKKHPIKNF